MHKRLDDITERVAQVFRPGVRPVLLVLAAVALAAWCVWAGWRGAQRQTGEADFDVTLICPQCGHTLATTFAKMHELPLPASVGGRNSRPAITRCPNCGKSDMYRAAACPQCGKPALVDGVAVGGEWIGPRCFSCGWGQKK